MRTTVRDRGFTLVETVVALSLLAVVLSSATALFIRSTRSSAEINRREVAVTLAQQGTELARGVNAQQPKTPVSAVFWTGLAKGRSQNDATAQQTAMTALFAGASFNPVTESTPAYDPTIAADASSSSAVLPLTTNSIMSTAGDYTTRTYLGYCELKYERLSKEDRTERDCVRDVVLGPTETNWGVANLVRILVVVTWTGPDCTTATSCMVSLDTLVDPATNQLVWQRGMLTAEAPIWADVADPDAPSIEMITNYNTPFTFEAALGAGNSPAPPIVTGSELPRITFTVQVNGTPVVKSGPAVLDFIDRLEVASLEPANPQCNGTTVTPTSATTLTFTPVAGTPPTDPCWGDVTFQYTLVDVWGRRSVPVDATVTIKPPPPTAQAQAATTTWPNPASFDVVSGALPNGVTVSCAGTASVSVGSAACDPGDATKVRYVPPSTWPGSASVGGQPPPPVTVTMTYQLVDPYGQVSNAAPATVTLLPPPPPTVPADIAASVRWGSSVAVDVVSAATPVGGTYRCAMAGGASTGTVACDSSPGLARYTPTVDPGTAGYTATFTYQVTDSIGQLSNVGRASVTVTPTAPPVANNVTGSTVWPNAATVAISATGGTPGYTCASVTSPTSRGGVAGCSGTQLTYSPPGTWVGGTSANFTDTFSYSVRDSAGRTSNVATVTVTVNRPAAPTAVADSATVSRNTTTTINVLANDTLPTGRPNVTVRVVSISSSRGSASVNANKDIVFVAGSRTSSGVRVVYEVKDALGQTSQATLTVRIV